MRLKRICRFEDFAFLVDRWEKEKKSEKLNKYLDRKSVLNMRYMVIPNVFSAFVTIQKGIYEGIEELENITITFMIHK